MPRSSPTWWAATLYPVTPSRHMSRPGQLKPRASPPAMRRPVISPTSSASLVIASWVIGSTVPLRPQSSWHPRGITDDWVIGPSVAVGLAPDLPAEARMGPDVLQLEPEGPIGCYPVREEGAAPVESRWPERPEVRGLVLGLRADQHLTPAEVTFELRSEPPTRRCARRRGREQPERHHDGYESRHRGEPPDVPACVMCAMSWAAACLRSVITSAPSPS